MCHSLYLYFIIYIFVWHYQALLMKLINKRLKIAKTWMAQDELLKHLHTHSVDTLKNILSLMLEHRDNMSQVIRNKYIRWLYLIWERVLKVSRLQKEWRKLYQHLFLFVKQMPDLLVIDYLYSFAVAETDIEKEKKKFGMTVTIKHLNIIDNAWNHTAHIATNSLKYSIN